MKRLEFGQKSRTRRWSIGSILFAGFGLLASAACGTSNGEDTKSSSLINCTPNANVFCLCEDGSKGTKPCLESGHAFGPCASGQSGSCKSEMPDPNTGKPVDDAGNVVEPADTGSTNPANPLEACPGVVKAVPADTDVTIEGDTDGASDDAKGTGACSVGDQGPDHVYHLKPTGKGSLSIKVTGIGAMNPTVYLRSTCEDESSQLKCASSTGAGGTEVLQMNVLTGNDYYLFVDSVAGSSGKYTVAMRLTSGYFCGDGEVNPNEACDDGNKIENDGCSNSCQKPDGDPPSGDDCPGQPVHVWPGKTVTATGSNTSYKNAWTKTGNSCIVSTNDLNVGKDHIYEVTAHAAGTLQVTLTPDPKVNLMLVARTTCADSKTQGTNMCANNGSEGATETMSFPVKNGEKVFVAVDGAGTVNNVGTYSVNFKIL